MAMPESSASRAWKKWGETNPYFGVLSDDAYRLDRLDDTARKEFFRTGEAHIEELFATIRQHLDPEFRPTVSVDFGCGTGRLVIPLARRSGAVVGIDVSDAMLDEARRNCERQSIENVEFATSVDQLRTIASRGYDFVHSYIVFQHIPIRDGMRIFEALLDGLTAGGVLALHFTVHREMSPMHKAVTWAMKHVPLVYRACQIARGRPAGDPPMQMNAYDLSLILATLRRRGVPSAIVQTTDHGGSIGAMVIAKKRP
jgi:trans-aconitate methyltransferase